ncbi:MAG: hypothetical protein EOP51_32065 [Sphingobacteriales bacterium]|nr:MAG: hypothetical protein EOP51_32065 [Sphingobacteriales bacterium]
MNLRAPAGSLSLPTVTLKASNTQGICHWFINGSLRYSASGDQPVLHQFDKPGNFQIIVADEQGKSAMVRGWVDAN